MNEIVKIEDNKIVVNEEVISKIIEFQKVKAQMDLLEKELKENLKDAMEKAGIKKFIVNGLCANIKDGYAKKTLDSKKLKEELPDIYELYTKESSVSSSITLTYED